MHLEGIPAYKNRDRTPSRNRGPGHEEPDAAYAAKEQEPGRVLEKSIAFRHQHLLRTKYIDASPTQSQIRRLRKNASRLARRGTGVFLSEERTFLK